MEKARQTDCKNNIHQFHIAILSYEDHHQDLPPWLSNLKDYLKEKKVYQCKSDKSRGAQGAMPPWFNDRYVETWDFFGADSAAGAAGGGGNVDSEASGLQDPWLTKNSYLYEFCCARCSWWTGGIYQDPNNSGVHYDAPDEAVDSNRDGKISWREAREFELETVGLQATPLVSCFWHTREAGHIVNRLSRGNNNIYTQPNATFDGWKDQ